MFVSYSVFLFLYNMFSSARNVSFRNYFLRPIYFIDLNDETKLSFLFVNPSVLFDCLLSSQRHLFFLSVSASVRLFFCWSYSLTVLLSANFSFFSCLSFLICTVCLSVPSVCLLYRHPLRLKHKSLFVSGCKVPVPTNFSIERYLLV